MKTFNEFWELLSPRAEYANRRRACYDLWNKLPENQQDALYNCIQDKLSKGKFVDYNPLFAMKNNSQPRQQVLSFADYYARYNTTEEMDGWKMENPTGQKVIYVNIETSEFSIQKVIRNGQLIIIRGDKEYNAQGQLIK